MRQLDSDEIKKYTFNILCDFAEFCDKNGIRYYLSGGTMLGAIRHKGFIPWDDDIDVLVPRPDFDRMHTILKETHVKPYYKLEGYNAGVGYYPFAKLVDVRTKVINEYSTVDNNLWIDIFPMDGLPDDIESCDEILSFASPLKINYNRAFAKVGKGKNIIRTIGKIPIKIYLNLFGLKKVTKKIDTLARKYPFEESEYVAGIAWSVGPRERMRREDYVPMVDVEFNGKLFHAPACWDTYLKQMFGDYMKLPPEDQRINHSNIVYIME